MPSLQTDRRTARLSNIFRLGIKELRKIGRAHV